MDPRHQKRINIVQNLFAHSFANVTENLPYDQDPVTAQIIKDQVKIYALITQYAPKFPLDRIAKIDLAILRLAVFELNVDKKEPTKVVINEAVELAKEFGGERSYAFVNAVLGMIVKNSGKEGAEPHE